MDEKDAMKISENSNEQINEKKVTQVTAAILRQNGKILYTSAKGET